MNSMKIILLISIICLSFHVDAQIKNKNAKVPSYFGLRVCPVFPTQFIGEKSLSLTQGADETVKINTSITQKIGYSFGGVVRAGLTKVVALETGLNFTQRSFDLTMDLPDSSLSGTNDFKFIAYDIPINALFYIKLSEKWYMNASLGLAVTFAPTHIGTASQVSLPPINGVSLPEKRHEFYHTGLVKNKIGLDLNANVGFEFRTEKNGFFYLGGVARVPFKPLFDLYVQYDYTGTDYQSILNGPVDGSFLSIELKYFFPNIKNKGVQFQDGPVEQ